MKKVKVLFQKGSAQNARTGEIGEVIFQHFSHPFNFRSPENQGLLKGINNFRCQKFGENIPPAMESDIRSFDGSDVTEIVISEDGKFFERAHYKAFSYERWNPRNFDPIKRDRKWKRLDSDEKSLVDDVSERLNKAFSASLEERLGDIKIDIKKVAEDATK